MLAGLEAVKKRLCSEPTLGVAKVVMSSVADAFHAHVHSEVVKTLWDLRRAKQTADGPLETFAQAP
eukprot:2324763-Pyramimonas_sp.AAC.1